MSIGIDVAPWGGHAVSVAGRAAVATEDPVSWLGSQGTRRNAAAPRPATARTAIVIMVARRKIRDIAEPSVLRTCGGAMPESVSKGGTAPCSSVPGPAVWDDPGRADR